ncbi:hypothetical protein RirG_011400 [Rhizophagus irregularis DAOM 197198w]|uniref:Uncharacterized protein n=1 Tax=Rhizophagus irregularis (strain DAOM 197198w) TaxID=1432141 RepID=A0A015KAN1_RHIIW|nr:hypothetical protein RirG_011400 [Rhizophagus irregularis DAOM 197198w]
MERDTLNKELEVVNNKVNENQKMLDKLAKSNENTKQVSPLELHEYESINETCSKRLEIKKPIHSQEVMEALRADREKYRSS